MPKQIFEIVRPPEAKPIDADWLEELLYNIKTDAERGVSEISSCRCGNPTIIHKRVLRAVEKVAQVNN